MAEDQKRFDEPVSFDEFEIPTYDDWKEASIKLLKGAPFEKKMVSRTYEGLTLKGMYWAEDVEGLPALSEVPGQAPYSRGTRAEGYGESGWLVAQGAESADPERAAAALRDDLAKGGEMAFVRLDEATRRMSRQAGHVNARSLYLGTQDRFDRLFEGVDGNVPYCIEAGAENFGLLAMALNRAEKTGSAPRGILVADPFGEWVRWGKLDDDPSPVFDRLAATVKKAAQSAPDLRVLMVDTTVFEAAGAHAVTQLAAAVAAGAELLAQLTERGLTVRQVCGALVFKVALGADFFMQIAKLRALRRLWAEAVSAWGGDNEDAKAFIYAETSAFTQTEYDPYVNLLRSSTQVFSGVVGGIDVLHVLPFDAAVRESTEQARRIARNQQVMFKTEFDLLTPVDPAGGSWYVERLTEELVQAAWVKAGEIDDAGGYVAALKTGMLQRETQATLQARFAALATRKDRAVGVNMYSNMTEQPLEISWQFDAQAHARGLQAELDVKRHVSLEGDLVECAAAALAAGACLADLADACNRRPSEAVEALMPRRWTEQYEALKNRTRTHLALGGENVKVFLANMGPVPQHKPRADFSRGFFEVGGFEVIGNDGFDTPDAAAEAALASDAHVVVICSTDAAYPEVVPPLARALKAQRPALKVVLAGVPAPEMKDVYLESGVDDFIHVKADCLSLLSRLQDERGMAR